MREFPWRFKVRRQLFEPMSRGRRRLFVWLKNQRGRKLTWCAQFLGIPLSTLRHLISTPTICPTVAVRTLLETKLGISVNDWGSRKMPESFKRQPMRIRLPRVVGGLTLLWSVERVYTCRCSAGHILHVPRVKLVRSLRDNSQYTCPACRDKS